MMSVDTRAGVSEALAALARATRSLASGAPPEPALAELVAAAAHGAGAELAALWLSGRGGLAVRAVWAALGTHAAELEGMRADSREEAERLVRGRLDGDAVVRAVPLDLGGAQGVLLVARRGVAFDEDGLEVAALAGELVGLALRLGTNGAAAGADGAQLELAGEALAAALDDEGAHARIAQLAARAAGADGALLWRLHEDDLAVAGSYRSLEPDDELARAAGAIAGEPRTVAVRGDRESGQVVTIQLGEPPLGVLQLRFAGGREPGRAELDRLAGFAVRAAHALRAAGRARDAATELERSRALLAVVGEAISRLSLAHTLDTAVERVGALLDTGRVAVYLREEGRLAVAACRGVEGPHEAVADALLAATLGSRQGGGLVEVDRPSADARLAHVHPQVAEAGIGAALAVPLVVQDEPIGLLAAYPSRPRPLTDGERALLAALASQLGVAVQNARLHERETSLGRELEAALAAEREQTKRLHAQHEISRSFAHSLSLQTTLDVLARSVVTLLDVDAAVIRLPDERRVSLIARAIAVSDERVDPAARTLLGRPQSLPRRELLALLERREPLIVDVERAEELGGALGLLAPFLRRGSSAALVPIATPDELLATLTIISFHPDRPVGGAVADTALAIAGQAALAIDNARLYGQQKAFADTMQRSLLPRAAPELPGLELGDVYESASRVEVGGDVYDYLTLPDGRLAVVLGDVTGHGVDAAADMAMAKYVFRALARDHDTPGELLAEANDVVCSEIAPGRFITLVALVLDPAGGEVACASAGHPPPRLVLPDGTVRAIAARGLALGVDAEQAYGTVVESFPTGAIVVAYTDGVVEARRDGEQFGVERLDELLARERALPPRRIADAALAACRAWADGGELKDDFALVVIKRSGPER
jgi:serine phosphatase RsbU (regulator of sigma subunit)